MVNRRSEKSVDSITSAVDGIRSELKRANEFLEEADRVEKYEDVELIEHIKQVKDITERMVDVLDEYVGTVELVNDIPKQTFLNRIFKKTSAKDPFSTTISKIDDIKDKILILNKHAKSEGIEERIRQALKDDHQRKLKRNINHELEEVYLDVPDDDIKEVMQMILDPVGDPFVSILREAGSGKTTIAKKVYEREEIQQHFECFAWIDINHESDTPINYQDLVEMMVMKGSSKVLRDTPTNNFRFLLQHRKCLIVLDDVRSIYELRFLIRDVARANNSTSKVLITTRVRRVAEIGRFHMARPWTENESWDLLYRISKIDTQEAETDLETLRRLEHIGRQIVYKCDRLPLAVATIGEILRTTSSSLNEWEKVLADIHVYLRMRGGSLETSFTLSYNSLPYKLKPCCLYMALFQKDEPIEATRLCHLWIAEGLVSEEDSSSNETLMEVAQRNLRELASWGMIEVIRQNEANKDIEWCKLHHLKKDVLHKKAKKEEFFEIVQIHACDGKAQAKAHNIFNKKARRLVMTSSDCQYLDLSEMESVRVLVVSTDSDFAALEILQKFKYLKVLEFDGCSFPEKQLPKEIFNILTLRYMLLNPTHDIELPSDAPAFPYIQTLNLLASHAIYVPNILCKMTRLKHLYLGYGCRPLASYKLQLKGLDELEILDIRKGGMVMLDDLPRLINLHMLGIKLGSEEFPKVMQFISDLPQTKWVRIATELPVDYISFDAQNRLLRVLEFDKMNELTIKGTFEVPAYEQGFLRNVSRLSIIETLIEGDPMKLLKHLPKLKELQLEDDEFMTDEIECDAKAFPQLVSLRLKWCSHLKSWRVDKNAFPKLSRLTIVGCKDLTKIVPEEGLRNLHALTVMEIHHMPEEFKKQFA